MSGQVYCTTADPLGLVYRNLSSSREKRLIYDPVYQVSELGPHSWIAALRYGNRVQVFRDGKLVRCLALASMECSILGWTNNALIYRTPTGVYALDVAKGSKRLSKHLAGAVTIHPAGDGYVSLVLLEGKLEARLYRASDNEPTYNTQLPMSGRYWESLVVGDRYLVVWAKEYNDNGDFGRDSLRVVDLAQRTQRVLPTDGLCQGLAPGGSGDELLVAYGQSSSVAGSASVEVEEVRLTDLSNRHLIAVAVRDSNLLALTADKTHLLMYVPYPDSGPGRPGKVFSVRLNDGHRQIVREDVYECVPVE